MILTLDDYKKHLPLNTLQAYNANINESHEKRALYKWFVKYLGMELVVAIDEGLDDDELLARLKPALANLTYLEALPFLNLVLTGSGFAVMNNQNMAPASSDRVRALAVGLLEAASNFLDSLLAYLESSLDNSGIALEDSANIIPDYSTWNKSCINTGSLLPNATVFSSRLNINNSRTTFINLIPYIREAETLQIANIISEEFLAELSADDNEDTKVKPLIQSALAHWAYERMLAAKPPHNDTKPESNYIYMQRETLQANHSALNARLKGAEFMLQAKSYLVKHLSDYPTFKNYAYETPMENKAENGFYIS
jgi:hypothetical protein